MYVMSSVMLILSSATVAGDKQVRVSDVGGLSTLPKLGGEIVLGTREANVRVLRCHQGRVKRIITEESSDIFLTVAEVCALGILATSRLMSIGQ